MVDEVAPYNACDYRCDRCESRGVCRLYLAETASRLRQILLGEDPDSPETAAEDLARSLAEAMEMLARHAKELGADLDCRAVEAKEEGEDLRDDPLLRKARAYALEAHRFLSWSEDNLFISPEIEPLFKDVGWQCTIIPAKIARALSMLGCADEVRQEIDATLKVVREAVAESRDALQKIPRYRPESAGRCAALLSMLIEVEDAVVKKFKV